MLRPAGAQNIGRSGFGKRTACHERAACRSGRNVHLRSRWICQVGVAKHCVVRKHVQTRPRVRTQRSSAAMMKGMRVLDGP
eukprot:10263408-Heterocapsa_arctica.AAC.1